MKTIFTGFAPNLTAADVASSCSFLLFPWRWRSWKKGSAVPLAESWLRDFFGVSHAVAFDSGRSALFLALRALGIGPGCDVLVQAYTCTVVVNAIRFTGATPIFADMRDNFFLNIEDAERKITPRAKAIILQHTFGIPGPVDETLALAKKYSLSVIEDCAHTIGGRYRGEFLGTFGDIGIFSFGSDKVVSCVRGGAAITNNAVLGARLREFQTKLPHSPFAMIARHLAHYPVFFIGKKIYHLGVGKALLKIARMIHLTPDIVTDAEKRGEDVHAYPTTLSNALATILLHQLELLPEMASHRKKIAELYAKGLHNPAVILPQAVQGEGEYVYLRYPVITNEPARLLACAKTQGIILGNWYDSVVAPCVDGCPHVGYEEGSCPHAEHAARGSVNLPTDISISVADAQRIIACVNTYDEKNTYA